MYFVIVVCFLFVCVGLGGGVSRNLRILSFSCCDALLITLGTPVHLFLN